MSQLAPNEGAALSAEPVEQTDATTETPESEETTLDDLYPDDAEREETQPDYPDDQDPNVNDEADAETGDDDNSDEGEDEPDDEPAIEPPHSWKAEAREHWNNLPRETQEYLRERDKEQTRFVNAKAQEAAQAQETVRQQAMQELAQFKEQQAQQYASLLNQLSPLQEPDERLLHTGNPQDHLTYQQQEAAYRRGVAQRQQLQRVMEGEATEAQRIRGQQEQQAVQAEVERLKQELPEWFDPEQGANLQRDLGAIATELGYPAELLPEANTADILALRKSAEWKAGYDKWKAYQKSKMAGVRSAKKKLPTPNKPGSHNRGAGATSDPVKLLYPND